MRHICRACGNEVFTNESLPLEFCTNCGTPISSVQTPNRAPNYADAAFRQGSGGSRLSGNEKLLFGILVSIPVLLILSGIAVVGVLFFKGVKREGPGGRYQEPRPYTTPTPPKNPNLLLSFGKEGFGQGEFKDPRSLAVDKDGNIYVGDSTLRIQKFDAEGKFVTLWNVTESTFKADDKYPSNVSHLAIDSKNRVYAVIENRELLRYDGATGKFIDKIELYGEKWMDQPQRAGVMDIVMLNDDYLAVLAYSFPEGEYVIKVSPDGKPEIKQKDLMKKQNPRSFRMTRGSLLVGVTGEIFLMNTQPMTEKAFIYRFKSDGTYVDRFTWDGAPGMTIFSSKIIALNSKGEVYAYSPDKKTIRILNVEGIQQRTIQVSIDYMEKMVLDANDNIFILGRSTVEKYSAF